MPTSYLCIFN